MKKYLLLLIFVPIFIAGCTSAEEKAVEDLAVRLVQSALVAEQPFRDVGTIAMDQGDAYINFSLTNTGNEPVVVKDMYTSCGCTNARISIGDETSRFIGMKHVGTNTSVMEIIQPGETTKVDVKYDPLFHGPNDIGLKRRTVFIDTNSSVTPQIRLDFQLNVVKTSSELPPFTTFDFNELEHDFGTVKQSGGIVKKNFQFTYNGDEPIQVTGVPTSCGCTTATIDKAELTRGDVATITVAFDPNLHEEPEGRFFKTVFLVTEPAIENVPELRIWAEIDLDLGPEAFKLNTHNS